ncbi:MAG TPA: hypothetical protein PLQ43_05095 [Deltaproteobacteria bacterium]|nr:hypothetical protein [Deltaproteobacteria bacterium]
MMVTYDVTIDDEPLKAWLAAEKLSTPVFMRPKVLLAITTRGPRPQERHEWWTQPTPASYSPFEEVMARRLRSSGENVIGPPAQKALSVKTEDWALVLGRQAGADIVVYGLLTHTRPEGTTVNSRLDLFVADVRSNSRLASTSLTLRGSLDVEVMNELVVSAVWEQVRSAIVARTVSFSPASREKTLCIQGMRDNEQYQEILGAIRSLGIVSSVTVSGISGRKLCHTVRTAADLQEVMRGLSQRLAIQADMEVDEDTALLRVLN